MFFQSPVDGEEHVSGRFIACWVGGLYAGLELGWTWFPLISQDFVGSVPAMGNPIWCKWKGAWDMTMALLGVTLGLLVFSKWQDRQMLRLPISRQ